MRAIAIGVNCQSVLNDLQLLALLCLVKVEIFNVSFCFEIAELIVNGFFFQRHDKSFQEIHAKSSKKISPKTRANITFSLYGQSPKMEKIKEIAKKNKIFII